MAKSTEDQFHDAMLLIYDKASKACPGYRPTRFRQMVIEHGGLEAARQLLASKKPANGFTELFLCGRLDLSMEALVLTPPYIQLFAKHEVAEAKRRLVEAS